MIPILECGCRRTTVFYFEIYADDPKRLADFAQAARRSSPHVRITRPRHKPGRGERTGLQETLASSRRSA
jgi:hypothetical protein